jgi:cytochrome c oxidase assembly protein subunit 15
LNPQDWMEQQDQLAEHGHRLLGMKLGFLAICVVVWTQLRESRRRVRQLAWFLLGIIVFQGLLGGLRVLLDQTNIGTDHNLIAQTFAVLHALGAQLVLCTLVALALVCSRWWIKREGPLALTASAWSGLPILGLVTCGVVLFQILLGAVMRHADAGLAIPTFPLTPEGGLIPSWWNFDVAIHFAHRAGAVVATAALVLFWARVWKDDSMRPHVWAWVVAGNALLAIQIYLGAATIWSMKQPWTATLHMLVGAFLLASTWVLTLLLVRLRATATEEYRAPARTQSRPPSLTPA